MDSNFGKRLTCDPPGEGATSGEIGKWGEIVARNYLAEKGIFTVRHARFRVRGRVLVSDLYHPSSKTAYEVKVRDKETEPNFRPRLHLYKALIDEGLVSQVVFFHVGWGGLRNISYSQWLEIKEAGITYFAIVG